MLNQRFEARGTYMAKATMPELVTQQSVQEKRLENYTTVLPLNSATLSAPTEA